MQKVPLTQAFPAKDLQGLGGQEGVAVVQWLKTHHLVSLNAEHLSISRTCMAKLKGDMVFSLQSGLQITATVSVATMKKPKL